MRLYRAYQGLVDQPPFSITIVQLDATKARYFFDGVALVRHDHYSSPTSPEQSEFPDRLGRSHGERLNEDSAAGKRTAETKTC